MSLRVVALGDSTSCGEGVGLGVPAAATWPALVAAALPGSDLVPLAVAGSRLRDVQAVQVPRAMAARPAVVTLLIGLNDIARAGFDAGRFQRDLGDVVRALSATGALLLLGRLHDVPSVLPLPARLATAVRARTAAVNAAVDACAAERVRVLDLARAAGLRHRTAWDVDRLHPNAAGHAIIARAAAQELRAGGLLMRPVPQPAARPAPGLLRETRWLVRHGLPWLAAHLPEVVLPAVTAAARPQQAA